MTSALKTELSKQTYSRDDALSFIEEVKARSKGNLPDEFRAILLASNPRYMKKPVQEFTEGWRHTYRSKGHPKAKGVDFSISYPASWIKREGNRPNIIQVFQSGAGYGEVMLMPMVKTIPEFAKEKPSPQDLKDFFSSEDLKAIIPQGGTFLSMTSIVIENLPAAMLVFDSKQQRMELTMTVRSTQFMVIYKDSMIGLQFAAAPIPGQSQSLQEIHDKFLPAYKAIVNTLVLNDKYK
jgi:hypothetical protein